jgi:hypothetical protein
MAKILGPTLRMGTPRVTLCVTWGPTSWRDAERHCLGAHAERGHQKVWLAGVLALLLTMTPPTPAAVTFGDISVNVEAEPRGNSSHGYIEYLFAVTNHSTDRLHQVRLTLPRLSAPRRRDSLREISCTAEVGPGETIRMALLQPDHPPLEGGGLAVTIDGRREETDVPVRLGNVFHNHYSPGHSTGELLVLISQSIRKSPPDPSALCPPASGVAKPQWLPAEQPCQRWSTNWLAYSRYDGLLVTAEDLRSMPVEVRAAVCSYAEAGGSLIVLGDAELLPPWPQRTDRNGDIVARPETDRAGFRFFDAGLGQCLVTGEDIANWSQSKWLTLVKACNDLLVPWDNGRNSVEANHLFPVVEDLGIPVKGLFTLMLLFTIVIGPVNFIVLARKKRRLWLLWTTPAISLLTCLAVFGYMLLSEGWEGHLRSETVTFLDEGTRRATTIGWTAVYSPLTPGDGLHFSPETEVITQRLHERRRSDVRSCTVDWTQDQHLGRGWVEARVPAHFKVRKTETRRERLSVRRGSGDQLIVVNGLGAAILRLWVADRQGRLYTRDEVAPGAEATASSSGKTLQDPPQPEGRAFNPQAALLRGDWLNAGTRMALTPQLYLKPGSYLAELDDTPFLEDPLPGATRRRCHGFVLGLLKESDDAR